MTTKMQTSNHDIKPEINISGVVVKNENNEIIKTIKNITEGENDN